MRNEMRGAQTQLEGLLRGARATRGLTVRTHGQDLIVGRPETDPDGRPAPDDRVKLTRISAATWGLSVKRHTGRWERTPFSGTMREMVDVIREFMQHLVAP